MIVLIVGDFGVGKNTVEDMLYEKSIQLESDVEFAKIRSYTTRTPRYEGEDTHIFCSKEEFLSFNDLIAQTKIDNNYYGARSSQFSEDKINLYCVDSKGVKDITELGLDDVFVVEVIRPVWLRNASKDRLNRERHFDEYKYKADYRVLNDGSIEKLDSIVLDLYTYLLKSFSNQWKSVYMTVFLKNNSIERRLTKSLNY